MLMLFCKGEGFEVSIFHGNIDLANPVSWIYIKCSLGQS